MKLNIKKVSIISALVIIISASLIFGLSKNLSADNQPVSESVNQANITDMISASGDVETQNQANLTFLTSGRITYLGVKEGDSVKKGEVLANLDTTIAAHNVTAAEAEYRSAQSALDEVLDNIHLFQYGNGGFANVGSDNETQTQKTERQQAEEAANVAYDNLQIANKELELQSIVAPFDGKVLSIQNIAEGVNVSPTSGNTITVVGGGELKFVANILEQDINQIHIGQPVTIKLDDQKNLNLNGTVTNIAAEKITLPDGRNVFQVDIQSNDLQTNAQAGQTGTIQININQSDKNIVPSWVILANQYVWVISNGQAVLKEITIGSTIDGQTSITSGLLPTDQVILDPEMIAKNKYKLL